MTLIAHENDPKQRSHPSAPGTETFPSQLDACSLLRVSAKGVPLILARVPKATAIMSPSATTADVFARSSWDTKVILGADVFVSASGDHGFLFPDQSFAFLGYSFDSMNDAERECETSFEIVR